MGSRFGNSKNIGEKNNFICPNNSAIYKVDSLSDSKGIVGLKFHCQDITTGKLTKSYNNNNRKVYGVTFGMEPKSDTQDYNYDKVECKIYEKNPKEFYPSFISEIGGDYSSDDKSIQNLKFTNCSVYNK